MNMVVTDTGPLLHLHQVGAMYLLEHLGMLRVDPSITGDNQSQGTLTWIKPQQPATSKDTVLKDGFGPLTVSAMGNPYVAPAIGQRVVGAALSASANNSTLSFTGGGLSTDFSQALLIRSTTTTANTA